MRPSKKLKISGKLQKLGQGDCSGATASVARLWSIRCLGWHRHLPFIQQRLPATSMAGCKDSFGKGIIFQGPFFTKLCWLMMLEMKMSGWKQSIVGMQAGCPTAWMIGRLIEFRAKKSKSKCMSSLSGGQDVILLRCLLKHTQTVKLCRALRKHV